MPQMIVAVGFGSPGRYPESDRVRSPDNDRRGKNKRDWTETFKTAS
jgi:hypothetical protein